MKKLVTVSLFIFGVVLTSILTAGLVFYQNNKSNLNQIEGSKVDALMQNKINNLSSSGKSLILNMSEIKKHSKSSDCWMLINGNVYDITSFFGSHPGGNSVMAATCGTDATDAYMTKDPNATKTTGGRNHSSNALSMLTSYYIGNLNQSIGTAAVTQTNSVVAPRTRGGDNEWDD